MLSNSRDVFFRDEDKSTNNLPRSFCHPDLMMGNDRCIVGKHRSRRLPYAWNIVVVGRLNTACQRWRICWFSTP